MKKLIPLVPKILLLGIGNILRSDEGAGVHLVNYIKENSLCPENTEIVDGGTLGLNLLSILKGRQTIIIVDAVKTDDFPGTVFKLSLDDILALKSGFSLHQINILEVIKVLKLLGENPQIIIFGIVPRDINTVSMTLSDEVKRAIPQAAELIVKEIENL